MTQTSPTHATCPLCSKVCKLSKTGKLSTHGSRGGMRHNHCLSGGFVLEDATRAAVRELNAYASELEGTRRGADKAVALRARAAKLVAQSEEADLVRFNEAQGVKAWPSMSDACGE